MPIIMRTGGASASAPGLPEFTYTGAYSLLDDGYKNWRIKFFTSGTFTPIKNITIDVFCVGGGGGTGGGGGGSGAGYTTTHKSIVAQAGVGYSIIVGAGGAPSGTEVGNMGGSTSAFTHTIIGGYGNNSGYAGAGGSGGGEAGASSVGGVNGGNGTPTGAAGQGTTTKEFGDANGTLYSTGGSAYDSAPGATNGASNTGNGARGRAGLPGYSGGSGIVVIRNHRAA